MPAAETSGHLRRQNLVETVQDAILAAGITNVAAVLINDRLVLETTDSVESARLVVTANPADPAVTELGLPATGDTQSTTSFAAAVGDFTGRTYLSNLDTDLTIGLSSDDATGTIHYGMVDLDCPAGNLSGTIAFSAQAADGQSRLVSEWLAGAAETSPVVSQWTSSATAHLPVSWQGTLQTLAHPDAAVIATFSDLTSTDPPLVGHQYAPELNAVAELDQDAVHEGMSAVISAMETLATSGVLGERLLMAGLTPAALAGLSERFTAGMDAFSRKNLASVEQIEAALEVRLRRVGPVCDREHADQFGRPRRIEPGRTDRQRRRSAERPRQRLLDRRAGPG